MYASRRLIHMLSALTLHLMQYVNPYSKKLSVNSRLVEDVVSSSQFTEIAITYLKNFGLSAMLYRLI